jgi:transposase
MVKIHLSAAAKHLILTAHSTRQPTPSFRSLAYEFSIAGGHQTIANWYNQWNGTIESLKEGKKSGRPRILSKSEVTRHIQQPVKRKNHAHQPIHYTELLPRIIANSGKKPSIQTIRRYGRQEAGIKQKRTHAVTVDECTCSIQSVI